MKCPAGRVESRVAEFFLEYGLFLAKIVTVVIALGVVIGLVAMFGNSARRNTQKGHIELNKLNDDQEAMRD
ncbi:MAG: hypothetical protein KDJ38_19315, partial [Gammaproteobacteria bacterium]|nr:hypothetical protein [Gammaproteobacteria bacterium]